MSQFQAIMQKDIGYSFCYDVRLKLMYMNQNHNLCWNLVFTDLALHTRPYVANSTNLYYIRSSSFSRKSSILRSIAVQVKT